ncbi:virion core protein, T7 gp14 family [Sphingobium limneticum]|nr:hypothetical protein [Sphingobium limneticum]
MDPLTMCAPVATLALIGTAISAAGTGFAAVQSSAQSRYAANVADQNARLSAEAARTQQDATRQELQTHWRRQAQLQGQQRVAMAAGGLDLGFGNAADLSADTAMLGREDAQRIIDQGANAVKGFDIEGSNYRSQAQASRQAASGALVDGVFGVATTALGGAQQHRELKIKYGKH